MAKLLSRIMLNSSSCQMSFAKLFTLLHDTEYNKGSNVGGARWLKKC